MTQKEEGLEEGEKLPRDGRRLFQIFLLRDELSLSLKAKFCLLTGAESRRIVL